MRPSVQVYPNETIAFILSLLSLLEPTTPKKLYIYIYIYINRTHRG